MTEKQIKKYHFINKLHLSFVGFVFVILGVIIPFVMDLVYKKVHPGIEHFKLAYWFFLLIPIGIGLKIFDMFIPTEEEIYQEEKKNR